MRGEILKFYIDEKLRIFGNDTEKTSTQTGFGSHVIDHIEFSCGPEEFKNALAEKKSKTNSRYWNWEYENSDAEED